MCGLTGFFSTKNIDANIALDSLKNMIGSIRHRGPDKDGIWIDKENKLFFGHTRLSIIDLSESGDQPMISKNKKNILVFNGEIINYREIKKKINLYIKKNKIDDAWYGTSDTEVLLKSLDLFGVDETLNTIDGMFAFAYWNNQNKKLYLARDRTGEKPLYYSLSENLFIYGSELKSIISFPNIKREICPFSRKLFFQYGYIPCPKTIYKDIFKIEPGNFLEVSVKNEILVHKSFRYWKPNTDSEENNSGKILSNLEDLITNSVKKNLIADVPVGCFLSGGIDSSLVTSIASKVSEKKLDSYTIGFENKEMDESIYAKKIARHLGTNHNEIIVREKDVLELLPSLGEIYDEPFSDNSSIPSIILSKFAKINVKSCLSGDGGDELFGGYRRYHNTIRVNKIISNPFLSFVFDKIPKISTSDLHNKFHSKLFFRLMKILDYKDFSNTEFLYKKIISFSNIFKFEDDQNNSTNFEIKNISNRKMNELMLNFDFNNYLPDNNLTKMDRASMKSGLEVRSPFLSKEIIEYVLKIDPNLRINKNKKFLITRILEKYVPNILFERPKKGFSIPLHSWLNGKLNKWASDLLCRENLILVGINNIEDVLEVWKNSKRRNLYIYEYWNLIVYIQWYKNFFYKK